MLNMFSIMIFDFDVRKSNLVMHAHLCSSEMYLTENDLIDYYMPNCILETVSVKFKY